MPSSSEQNRHRHSSHPLRKRFDAWYQQQMYLPAGHPRKLAASTALSFLDRFSTGVVLYEDPDIIVINKPAGLPSHGSDYGVSELVQVARASSDIHVVHRLDRDTTGVLMLGKSREARGAMASQFDRTQGEKTAVKTYLALARGEWDPVLRGFIGPLEVGGKLVRVVDPTEDAERREVRIQANGKRLEEKMSSTGIHVVAHLRDNNGQMWSLLAIDLYTGRTHQIRVTADYLGGSLMGDPQYGPDATDPVSGQMLHAYSLTINMPQTGERKTFKASLPKDFQRILRGLKRVRTFGSPYEEVLV
ncbi:MAG TPA: RluA family pseudouridine synthase [Patescibacteria group bacterium]